MTAWKARLVAQASPAVKKVALAWRCHGKLVAMEERLWKLGDVQLMCASWNTNGKVLPSENIREWIRAAEAQWGAEGAQVSEQTISFTCPAMPTCLSQSMCCMCP